MNDKLIKLNKKKTPAIDIIRKLNIYDVFYDWMKKYNPIVNGSILSIKRLAKIFLAEYPSYYTQYEKQQVQWYDVVKIAKFNAYED